MKNVNCSENQRQHKRFTITLHAKVITGGITYDGVIGNVCEEGVSSTITTYIKADEQFAPRNSIQLAFELPSGDRMDLNCEVRWYLRPKNHAPNLILGLYILDPPSKYTEWIGRFG